MKAVLRRPVLAWRAARPYLGGSPRWFWLVAGLSFVKASIEALVLLVIAQIALGLSESRQSIEFSAGPVHLDLGFGAGVLLCILGGAAMLGLAALISRMAGSLAAAGMTNARNGVLDAFTRASWELQSTERTGRLQDLMTSYVNQVATATLSILNSLSAGLSFLVLIAVALVVNVTAAITMVLATLALVLILFPMTRLSRSRSRRQAQANREFAEQVTETASIALEARVFGVQDVVQRDELEPRIVEHERRFATLVFLRKLVPAGYQSGGVILIAAVLGVAVLAEPGDLTSVAVVVLLLVRAIAYGQQLQTVLQQVQEVIPQVSELRRVQRTYEASAALDGTRELRRVESLKLTSVSYVYPGAERPAIDDLSLEIAEGEMVGVVGPSGSGKSTFIQLLLRLRAPTTGAIRCGEVDLVDVTAASWFPAVALVPQTPRLITGTIADNIRFYRAASSEDIERAARAAHINDEILAKPDGYDTMLGGAGGSVSGGQAQRICIARALLAHPQLLVMDEPTSSLDAHSEAAVKATLDALKGTVTLVVIAHRMSTLERCDRIVVLEGGALSAFEEPASLLGRQDGFFRQAVELSQL